MLQIGLSEWERADPWTHAQLRGVVLDSSPTLRTVVDDLKRVGMLGVTELRHGLEITSQSYVGSVRLGDLQITITPKVEFDVLASLFRYAYGLRDLHRFGDVSHNTRESTFQDLLIEQLAGEVSNLLARGIHRSYVPVAERLSSPRGRIDVMAVVRGNGVIDATIPCAHFPRLENNILNQTLLAGIRFAARLTANRTLRSHLHRLAGRLEADVALVPMSDDLLAHTRRALSRLTSAYEPACTLIALLFAGTGVTWEDDEALARPLPGFLFDMNRFFEALVTRFLTENLRGVAVRAQHRLTGMMAYRPDRNPLHRRSPTPRPDVALLWNGSVVKLLDAKYRDLWEKPLPREMLYQLALYALSQPMPGDAIIVYPATESQARQQVIDIREPTSGKHGASVTLRPLHLAEVAKMVSMRGARGERARIQYAEQLVGSF